jgi:hypothetical protein
MIPVSLQDDFEVLPPEAKQQVVDFVAFMKERYARESESKSVDKADIESSFGIVKVNKHVTLEQMDEAVSRMGGEL